MLDRSSSCSLPQPIIHERRTNRLSLDHAMICYLRSPRVPLCTTMSGGAGALLNCCSERLSRSGLLAGEAGCRHERRALPPSLWRQMVGDVQVELQAELVLLAEQRLTIGMRRPLDCAHDALRGVWRDPDRSGPIRPPGLARPRDTSGWRLLSISLNAAPRARQ